MKLISTNPAKNYEVIGEVEASTLEEIQEKVANARKAQIAWGTLSVRDRITALQSFVEVANKRKDEIAKIISLETGRPIKTAYSNIQGGIEYFEGYFRDAETQLAPKVIYEDSETKHTVYHEPWGVVACISPWNFPFMNVAWQCGQPLLAGNTVVFKNSEENPLFSKILEELITESSLPSGVFSVVYGDGAGGDILAHQDIDMICFTGSSKTGQHLLQVAAEKFIPAHMELGGSSPGIVFADADIDSVIETIYAARFDNSGQYCDGLKRLIIHESRFNELVEKLTKLVATKKVGGPFDETTDLGPLVAKRQVELLETQVKDAVDKGATVVIGGKSPEVLEGAYYLPTILTTISKDMRVWKEEVFGPVLAVVPFKTEVEAIELANDTSYGLTAYIFTQDANLFQTVAKQLKAGLISLNNVNAYTSNTPFGGYKKSGLGRQHGEFGFADVTQIKTIAEEIHN